MKHKVYLEKLAQGEELILPSGLEVRVKPIDSSILLTGNYPSELMAVIRKHTVGAPAKTEAQLATDLAESDEALETALSMRKFGEVVAENVVLYPKLVRGEANGDDEYPLSLFDSGDCYFLISLINLPLVRLPAFCQRQNAAMELVLAGKDDTPESGAGVRTEGIDLFDHAADPLAAVSLDGESNNG